ncbi:MAG TPA: 1-acyl-sn-glycerol-3-phosphate acyltransferase [Thermoanaerobaculia bacterium]|nr:1-acyl-sn-glycerol-3-phosphate acyltransferase [Thermoanaerobaculia bacterium]
MSWLLSDAWLAVVTRRLLTVSIHVLGAVVLGVAAPILLLVTGAIDVLQALRRRPVAVRWEWSRVFLFLLAYLFAETAGLVVAGWLWLRHGAWRGFGGANGARRWARYLDGNYLLQEKWISALGGSGLRLYGIRLRLEGEDAVPGGPILFFIRHASIADSVLAGILLQSGHGFRLRYVLKRRLLLDPCFDIVGNRLPNRFARRGSDRPEEEVAAVAKLAEGLGRDEGVLIYPEGTRFTPEKRERLLATLEERGAVVELERARRLCHVLPPRLGGPLALLETNARSATPANALFCAHAGFEGGTTLGELLRGQIIGRTVYIRFWRVPFAEIPHALDERVAWLYGEWEKVEEFVKEHACSP